MDDYNWDEWDAATDDYMSDRTTQIDTDYLQEGDEGYGWQYFSDGTAISPGGEYYYQGELVYEPDGIWDTIKGGLGKGADALVNAFTKTVNGKQQTDWGKLAGVAGGLYGMYQSSQGGAPEKTGYQGGIPKYEAVREAVQGTYDPERRPGSGGQRYFSDVRYAAPEGIEAARAAAQEEAAGLATLNRDAPAREQRSPTAAAVDRAEESSAVQEGRPASEVIQDNPVPTYAQGGIAQLAKGGTPRYLAGATDGMADKIKTDIDGGQEARLSHGEFVIPADVVSHLGNGNSEAGAERLYAMMDRIRKARTGTTKQGKQINPDKFLAA
jgi:hypothetical protein